MKCPECGAADGLRFLRECRITGENLYQCTECGALLYGTDLEEIQKKEAASKLIN